MYSFSGLDEETAHHGNREEAARQLCYYRKYREEGHHNVPAETKEVLQNRIDPNYGERERKTVHALLYTPGGEKGKKLTDSISINEWNIISLV